MNAPTSWFCLEAKKWPINLNVDLVSAVDADRALSLTDRCVSPQSKRISAKDALAHPYLDEGRLRYHTCMCKCCYTTSSGRVYTSDFEPVTNAKFDDGFEKNLTSVRQVKGEARCPSEAWSRFMTVCVWSWKRLCCRWSSAPRISIIPPLTLWAHQKALQVQSLPEFKFGNGQRSIMGY